MTPSPPSSSHMHIIKKEPLDNIKEEDMDDIFEENPILKQEIKKELNTSMEEGELENSMINTSNNKLKFEGAVDKIFDESPYNKDFCNSLRLDERTPNKNEGANKDLRSTLKSAKRTVFSRLSPYKVNTDSTATKPSVKSRLGSVEEETAPKRKRFTGIPERDPLVIARREKQIEYGKNTIGYENYIKMVPKDERVPGDPKTPPLYNKYSRRGWEGLIKQWRIQLHQYDPPETNTGEIKTESVEIETDSGGEEEEEEES
ncbi:histone RNA hairpin-binding protein isoform X2 [Anthonomus grandis grandis]|nr:histone RNA hairpin-binding protein isoform X2 [Anthonomus grandis grandis]